MLRTLLLSLGLVAPIAASAQSLSYEGTVALSATDLHKGTGTGFIDATLTIPLSQRVPLGFELGTYLFALDGKRPHETYGAFVWNDTLRVGAVRPAYDAVLPSVFERAAPYLAYHRAEYARAHATVEAMRHTAVPWGASWQQSFGQTDLAVSAHEATKGGFTSASASIAYRGIGWTVAAAVESVWSPNGMHEGINAKLGARFDILQGQVGVSLLHADANSRKNALALDVTAPVSTKVDLLAFGEFTENGKDDAYGLGVDFKLRPTTSLLIVGTDGAMGPAAHLTLEQRF